MAMLVSTGLVLAPAAWGQAPPPPPMAEHEERPIPPLIPDDDLAVPEITIVPAEDHTIREYRRGGQIYMIEIVPAVGPSYFLVDTTGDGNFDTRRRDVETNFFIPQWMIFRW